VSYSVRYAWITRPLDQAFKRSGRAKLFLLPKRRLGELAATDDDADDHDWDQRLSTDNVLSIATATPMTNSPPHYEPPNPARRCACQQGKEPGQEWSEHLLDGGRPCQEIQPHRAKKPATARIDFAEPQGMPGSNQVVPPIVRLLIPHFEGHPIHFRK
jgi:hypothetical protein